MKKFGELVRHLGLEGVPSELYEIEVQNADDFCYYRIKKFLEAYNYDQILEDMKQVNKFNLPVYFTFEEGQDNQLQLFLLIEVD